MKDNFSPLSTGTAPSIAHPTQPEVREFEKAYEKLTPPIVKRVCSHEFFGSYSDLSLNKSMSDLSLDKPLRLFYAKKDEYLERIKGLIVCKAPDKLRPALIILHIAMTVKKIIDYIKCATHVLTQISMLLNTLKRALTDHVKKLRAMVERETMLLAQLENEIVNLDIQLVNELSIYAGNGLDKMMMDKSDSLGSLIDLGDSLVSLRNQIVFRNDLKFEGLTKDLSAALGSAKNLADFKRQNPSWQKIVDNLAPHLGRGYAARLRTLSSEVFNWGDARDLARQLDRARESRRGQVKLASKNVARLERMQNCIDRKKEAIANIAAFEKNIADTEKKIEQLTQRELELTFVDLYAGIEEVVAGRDYNPDLGPDEIGDQASFGAPPNQDLVRFLQSMSRTIPVAGGGAVAMTLTNSADSYPDYDSLTTGKLLESLADGTELHSGAETGCLVVPDGSMMFLASSAAASVGLRLVLNGGQWIIDCLKNQPAKIVAAPVPPSPSDTVVLSYEEWLACSNNPFKKWDNGGKIVGAFRAKDSSWDEFQKNRPWHRALLSEEVTRREAYYIECLKALSLEVHKAPEIVDGIVYSFPNDRRVYNATIYRRPVRGMQIPCSQQRLQFILLDGTITEFKSSPFAIEAAWGFINGSVK